MDYDFELDRIASIIKERKPGRVGIQLPEGLKRRAMTIADAIQSSTGVEVIISGEPCYGACDIDENLKGTVDLLLHFGHSELIADPEEKTIYVELHSTADVEKVVLEAVEHLHGGTIGLVTTVQHVNQIDAAVRILQNAGKKTVVGEGDSRVKHPAQVLGCNFSAARSVGSVECDEYLFIGSGDFHPLGVALSTGRRVVVAYPLMGEGREVNTGAAEAVLRQRYARIEKARDARTFGIIMGMKPGQQRIGLAVKLLEKAKGHGLETILIAVREITPEVIMSFGMDAYVSTACPRLTIDDAERFDRPILTPAEFEIAVGERTLEDYRLDEISVEAESCEIKDFANVSRKQNLRKITG